MLTQAFALKMKEFFPNRLPTALIGCSGGLDSMVLLDLLHRYYTSQGEVTPELFVVYLDHGQRPKKHIQKDIQVIKSACAEKEGVQFHAVRLDLPLEASEAQMRNARYAAFARLATPVNATLFTAHHADDQIETLLLRVLRGADPLTIKGIAAKAKRKIENKKISIVRPLLALSKTELNTYALQHNIKWTDDLSNKSPKYTRNRIRNELIPLCETIYQGSAKRLLAFFDRLVELQPAPDQTQVVKIQKAFKKGEGIPVLETDFLSLKAATDRLLDANSHKTNRAQWESLQKQLESRRKAKRGGGPRKQVQFPGGYTVLFEGNLIYFVRN